MCSAIYGLLQKREKKVDKNRLKISQKALCDIIWDDYHECNFKNTPARKIIDFLFVHYLKIWLVFRVTQ